MKNLKIGQRLAIAFSANLIILIIISILGLFGVNKTFDSVKIMYDESIIPLSALSNVEYLITRNRILIMDMVLNNTPENVVKRNTEIDKNLITADEQWKVYTGTHLTDPEKELVTKFEPALNAYRTDGLLPMRQLVTDGKIDDAIVIYNTKVHVLSPAVFENLSKLKEIQVKLAKEQYELSTSVNDSVKIFIWCCTIVATMIGIILAWLITKSIVVPMSEAVRISQAVADGDLTSNIVVNSKDETGTMLQALKNMNGNLKNIVTDVRHGTNEITIAAIEIAQGNLDLSARTENQSASLEETASAMNELTSTVRANSESAKSASNVALTTSTTAILAGDAVKEAVDTMRKIEQSSSKIVEIIGTINGIAFQTNILALNAAVEAARAGEQGRGFAVVATEVRALSHRSAAAAKEIEQLIQNSVKMINTGVDQVNHVGTVMDDIVVSVKHVTDIMSEIAKASLEQAQGIEQVNSAIIDMEGVTQQNAALVEEAAAAAQSMQDQARRLVDRVNAFKLES